MYLRVHGEPKKGSYSSWRLVHCYSLSNSFPGPSYCEFSPVSKHLKTFYTVLWPKLIIILSSPALSRFLAKGLRRGKRLLTTSYLLLRGKALKSLKAIMLPRLPFCTHKWGGFFFRWIRDSLTRFLTFWCLVDILKYLSYIYKYSNSESYSRSKYEKINSLGVMNTAG